MSQLPKRLQDWDGCPHVKPCDHCGGRGFLRGVFGSEPCPACKKYGVRWAGTIYPAMEAAGYRVVNGECLFVPKGGSGTGYVMPEPSVLANVWEFAKVNGGEA